MELNKVSYVKDIPLKVDEGMVLTRLSYKKTKTQADTEILNEIKRVSNEALMLSKPCGAYTFVNCKILNDTIVIDNNIEIKSEKIASKFSACVAVTLLSVTLGKNIDREISDLLNNSEYTKAVILDTVASVLSDSAVEGLMEHVNTTSNTFALGKFRAGPGQLNIPLELQRNFYNMLNLNNIDIEINNNLMLSPQKSLISIAGVFKK